MSQRPSAEDELSSLRIPAGDRAVEIIDQTRLPHRLQWRVLDSLDDYCGAIETMQVRGAPLIGITAAFGLAAELLRHGDDQSLARARARLLATRPTAINLRWALDTVIGNVSQLPPAQRGPRAWQQALDLRQADIANCARIGDQALPLLQRLQQRQPERPLQIMTHCNAGSLATIRWGTALAPVYKLHEQGLPLHVWVSETRPRNQGMYLTAWELRRAGIPHTIVADNSCGLLMQQGQVDCCIVGSDRTVANGDVCNKIGTYLKALAAREHGIPFYVALPLSSIDWQTASGVDVPIEWRDATELTHITGMSAANRETEVALAGPGSAAVNPAFDITPAHLVTALITERGVFPTSPDGMSKLRNQIEGRTD